MNTHGILAIYRFEMARWKRTLWQSLITPVITTALYFVVFGSALGSRMTSMDGVSFGAFIVPGLTLLSVFMQSIFNASFGIYFPKFVGTIYELLSAPISSFEAVLAYVGAAVTKSVILALVTIATATLFVPVHIVRSATATSSSPRPPAPRAAARPAWPSRRNWPVPAPVPAPA